MANEGSVFTGNAVFVLVSIFAMGILTLLVINPAIDSYVRPALLDTTSGDIHDMLENKYDFIMSMLKLLPYIIFAIGVIYLLVLIFRKEEVSSYG